MKKWFFRLSICAALVSSFYAFRHFFIGMALEYGMQKGAGSSLTYHSRYWEDGRLYYEGFSLGDQIYAEEAAFEFQFHLFPLSVEAAIHLNTPTVQLNDSNRESNFAFLLPTQFWTVKLNIEKGSLLSAEEKLCLFNFSSGQAKEEIGTLAVYQDDGAPLLTCQLNHQEGDLLAHLQMDGAPLNKTLPLVSLFYHFPVWKALEGTASASIEAAVNIEKVTTLKGQFSLQNVRLESDDLIFAADKAESIVDFQGDFESFALDSDFKGVDLFWKELEVQSGEGAIVFKPQKTPTFEVHAAVHMGDVEGRADIVGKGQIQNNQSMWLEGTLDYVTASNPLRIEFTWADDGDSQVLQTEIHNLGKEVLGLLNHQFPWKIQQGTVDGGATLYLEERMLSRLQLDHMRVHQLAGHNLLIPEAEVEGSLNLLSGDIQQLIVKAHDVEGEIHGWNISQTQTTISIQDNAFEPSSAFGKFEQIPFALELHGPISSFHASAKFSAGASEWLKLPRNSQESPVTLDLVFDRKEEEVKIQGVLACLEDTVQIHAMAHLSSALLKGGFQSSRLQSTFYTPFLKLLVPSLALQGDLSLRGQFTEKAVDILAQGDDLILNSPELQFFVLGPSHEVLYHFDFVQKEGSGKATLPAIVLNSPKLPQPISLSGGNLVFDHHALFCQGLSAQFNGIELQGDLTASWKEKIEASFVSQKAEGSLENLTPFYQAPLVLKGQFTCPPEGLQMYYMDGQFNYQLNALLENVEGALTSKIYLQKTSCSLAFNSLENQLVLQNVKGVLSRDFTISAQKIQYNDGQWHFDAALSRKDQSVLSLRGQALKVGLGYQITLEEAKASSSYLKSPLSFKWNSSATIDQVRGVVFIDTENLVRELSVLDQLGLFKMSSSLQERLKPLKGGLTLKLTIDSDHSEYEMTGSRVRYASTIFDILEAHVVRQVNGWSLKKCILDDIRIKGQADFRNEKWVISACDILWKDLQVHSEGVYEKERFDFKATGLLMERFSFKGKGSFLSGEPQFQNLSLQFLDKSELLAYIIAEQMAYKSGKWESSAIDLTVFSKQLTEDLKAKLQLSLSPKSISFQGPVTQGEVKLGEGALKITQLYGLYEAPYLNLKCVARLEDEPVHMIAKLSKDHQFGGGVNIQRGKETLKLSLSHPTKFHRAEGDLLGLTVNLKSEGQGYRGTVLLKDGNPVAKLTGNENFKDFSGVLLTGLFTKETFKGEIEGHDARIKEYLVQELRGTVDYGPTRFRIRNLQLQDPAGSLTIKECDGIRSAASDKWNLSIPILKGQEIKPSVIRKLGAPPKESKPLQIRFFVMTDIRGQLGDLNSFRGLGKFNFTQRMKKEPSFFDIPLTLLKDLGLDLDIFSPVMGEAEMQLREGKLFFTQLHNTFSEGKRSEFYLASEPSYIDLKGDLFLNLRMQQNVVLKFVEPFMIAVRGTWEKPKYSLQ